MIFVFCVERLTSNQHFENCFFKQITCTKKKTRLVPEGRNVSESNKHRPDVNLLLCCRRMFGLFTHCVFSSSGSSTPCSGAVTMDFLSLWSRRHLCTNRSSASAQEECKQDRRRGAWTDERTFQSKPPKTKLFSNRNDTFLLRPTVLGPSGSFYRK